MISKYEQARARPKTTAEPPRMLGGGRAGGPAQGASTLLPLSAGAPLLGARDKEAAGHGWGKVLPGLRVWGLGGTAGARCCQGCGAGA